MRKKIKKKTEERYQKQTSFSVGYEDIGTFYRLNEAALDMCALSLAKFL